MAREQQFNSQDMNAEAFDETLSDPRMGNGLDPWEGANPTDMIEAETAESNYGVGPRGSLQRGTIIIMAACILGVAGIFFFGLKNKPKAASAADNEAEAKVDQVLQRLTDNAELTKAQKIFSDTDSMVQTFYDYPSKQQVALEELQRNPFDLPFEAKDSQDGLDRLRAKRRGELEKQLDKIKLQSIIQGPAGSKCMIGGMVYGKGDTVAGIFQIQDIQGETVTVTAEAFEFTMNMQ